MYTLRIVGGIFAAGLLVLGIVAAVLVLRDDRTIPASEWETFTTPDGSCSVLMPGKPVPHDPHGLIEDRARNNLTFYEWRIRACRGFCSSFWRMRPRVM